MKWWLLMCLTRNVIEIRFSSIEEEAYYDCTDPRIRSLRVVEDEKDICVFLKSEASDEHFDRVLIEGQQFSLDLVYASSSRFLHLLDYRASLHRSWPGSLFVAFLTSAYDTFSESIE